MRIAWLWLLFLPSLLVHLTCCVLRSSLRPQIFLHVFTTLLQCKKIVNSKTNCLACVKYFLISRTWQVLQLKTKSEAEVRNKRAVFPAPRPKNKKPKMALSGRGSFFLCCKWSPLLIFARHVWTILYSIFFYLHFGPKKVLSWDYFRILVTYWFASCGLG